MTNIKTEKSLAPTRILTPDRPSGSLIVVPTTLLRLRKILWESYRNGKWTGLICRSVEFRCEGGQLRDYEAQDSVTKVANEQQLIILITSNLKGLHNFTYCIY